MAFSKTRDLARLEEIDNEVETLRAAITKLLAERLRIWCRRVAAEDTKPVELAKASGVLRGDVSNALKGDREARTRQDSDLNS